MRDIKLIMMLKPHYFGGDVVGIAVEPSPECRNMHQDAFEERDCNKRA